MIRCIIVEDEPLAADILEDYIGQLPHLQLVGKANDATEALALLHKESIDLIFLDIHLPGLKGIDFLKTLRNAPAIILTTAYHQYALEGYKLNVTDYLLKPIEFNRFVEAVNKVVAKTNPFNNTGTITIYTDKKNVVLARSEIVFIESQKEYIKIQCTTKSYLSKYALSKIEEELDPAVFLRVHRSFIINLHHLKTFNAQEVGVLGMTIPIGGNYREVVAQRLKATFHR